MRVKVKEFIEKYPQLLDADMDVVDLLGEVEELDDGYITDLIAEFTKVDNEQIKGLVNEFLQHSISKTLNIDNEEVAIEVENGLALIKRKYNGVSDAITHTSCPKELFVELCYLADKEYFFQDYEDMMTKLHYDRVEKFIGELV